MRASYLCWIGLALLLAGCCAHESAPTGDGSAKSADSECKTGDCCSTVTRSSLLKKNSTAAEEAKTPETK